MKTTAQIASGSHLTRPLLILTAVMLLASHPAASQTAVCHVPPSHDARAITVDDAALGAHLAHGDCPGGCPCATRRASTCSTQAVRKVHGKGVVAGNARLAPIVNNMVACIHVDHGVKAECVFKRNSGTWVETADGNFALVGLAISLDGKPGGDYIVAAEVSTDGTVACVDPTSRDTAGRVPSGTELLRSCMVEEMLMPWNASFQPLLNYATKEVCTSSNPHPDFAEFTRMQGASYCYIGAGAGLNDLNGFERDETGTYIPGETTCHVVVSGGYEVPGAKRPATKSLPAPGAVNPNTPIVWRPVNPNVEIAN
jgi:hypothetical protein